MSKNTSFSVGEPMQAFIHKQVESGRYASASEVVREGLRMLEKREATYERKMAALERALQAGEDSGYIENFDWDAFIIEMQEKYGPKG